MPFPLSSEQSRRISDRIGEKVTKPCPLCGEYKWTWGADLVLVEGVAFEVAAPPNETPMELLSRLMYQKQAAPPQTYPALPLMCGNCGNTMLLNVYTLGLAAIWPDLAKKA